MNFPINGGEKIEGVLYMVQFSSARYGWSGLSMDVCPAEVYIKSCDASQKYGVHGFLSAEDARWAVDTLRKVQHEKKQSHLSDYKFRAVKVEFSLKALEMEELL